MSFSGRAGALVGAARTQQTVISFALLVVTSPAVRADLGPGVCPTLRPLIVVSQLGRLPMVALGLLGVICGSTCVLRRAPSPPPLLPLTLPPRDPSAALPLLAPIICGSTRVLRRAPSPPPLLPLTLPPRGPSAVPLRLAPVCVGAPPRVPPSSLVTPVGMAVLLPVSIPGIQCTLCVLRPPSPTQCPIGRFVSVGRPQRRTPGARSIRIAFLGHAASRAAMETVSRTALTGSVVVTLRRGMVRHAMGGGARRAGLKRAATVRP